jgi:hypothetical protein
MINVIDSVDKCTIVSDKFKAILSKRHGGSLRSLEVLGFDTGLKREGCEYWVNRKHHYEQEFGKVLDFSIIHVVDDEVSIRVKATLVSPKEREIGGECEIYWSFLQDGTIITKSKIDPTNYCYLYDKYICFDTYKFKSYKSFKDSGYKKIEHPKDKETVWWEYLKDGIEGFFVSEKNIEMRVAFDKRLSLGGIYTSRSMMEIKFQDTKPRYDEFVSMELKGEINVKHSAE